MPQPSSGPDDLDEGCSSGSAATLTAGDSGDEAVAGGSMSSARLTAATTVPGPPRQRSRPLAGGVTNSRSERARLRLVAGRVIPGTRYRLLRWLGEGGMGVVYEAEHVDIERRVALKILRFDLSQQPDMVQVFRDEARAASRTGHPNIVEVFDFGELSDGRLFFCMELLDGKDLVPAEDQVFAIAEVIPALRQLCKGLAAAHQQGIVHRDIKPDNIILVERGGRHGVVKLVDFGISAMLAVDADGRRTRISGTPHYMAPEQIRGGEFDSRLDMYAVGCVAYELLTGAPPFPGEAVEEVLLAQLDDPPVPLRQTATGKDLHPAFEAVIMQCLAKRPEDRYADMCDLEAALCEAQIAAGVRTDWDDLPLPEVDKDRKDRIRRGMPKPFDAPKRRRWLLPVAVAASLAAGVAITFSLVSPPADDAELRAHQQRIDAIAEEALLAASLTHYVAPPFDNPSAPTAYLKVRELEAISGPTGLQAQARAHDLRQKFAAGLVTLGDKYWDVPGVRPFAIEYYVWARTFDPTHPRAVERSGLTDGNFAFFQDKASRSAWHASELQSLSLVGVLAEEDIGQQQARVDRLLAEASLSLREMLAVDEGLRGAGLRPPVRARPAPAPEPEPEPIPEVLPTPEDEYADPTETDPTRASKPNRPVLVRNKRDPVQARKYAEEGAAALRSGRRSEAENLFHQAIAYDNRNVQALMGLSDVYFDTGAKQKSVTFAELAVEAAPKSRAPNLKLGDAYYNVLRYRDALKHYERALDLGDDNAQSRIDKVKARIGG